MLWVRDKQEGGGGLRRDRHYLLEQHHNKESQLSPRELLDQQSRHVIPPIASQTQARLVMDAALPGSRRELADDYSGWRAGYDRRLAAVRGLQGKVRLVQLSNALAKSDPAAKHTRAVVAQGAAVQAEAQVPDLSSLPLVPTPPVAPVRVVPPRQAESAGKHAAQVRKGATGLHDGKGGKRLSNKAHGKPASKGVAGAASACSTRASSKASTSASARAPRASRGKDKGSGDARAPPLMGSEQHEGHAGMQAQSGVVDRISTPPPTATEAPDPP